MKRQIMACFYLCVTSILFGNDVTINEATTFSQDQTTSVVISYSGVEKLKFFALDSTDGVLSLDIPGAYSRFDFTGLSFSQVREIKQMPLDPDVSSGISIRFYLQDRVTYKIFEGSQSLTLLFENGSSEKVLESQAPTLPQQGFQHVSQKLEGKAGEKRIAEVTIQAAEQGGTIEVRLDREPKNKQFFLKEPSRFVVDLDDTVLGLSTNRYDLNHPLVKRVRFNQFQTSPTPVTRMVLDLSAETQVQVVPSSAGIRVHFAANQDLLALQAGAKDQEASAEPVAASQEQAVPQSAEEDSDKAVEPPATIAETISEDTEEVVATAPIAETTAPEASVAPQADGIQQAAPESQSELVAVAAAPALVVEEPAATQAPEQEVVETSPQQEASKAAKTEPAQAPAPIPAPTPIAEDRNLQSPMASEPVSSPSLDVPSEAQIAEATSLEETSSEKLPEPTVVEMESSEGVKPSEIPAIVPAESIASAPQEVEIEEAPSVVVDQELLEKEDTSAETDGVVMASDIDLEMQNFLKEESAERTIYQQMKGQRSTRKSVKDIMVTNERISAKKAMIAASQDVAQEEKPGEFSELFEEKEDSIKSVGGEEEKYRGFDIMIDIRDQPVIDLLRFLAEEVGFNLYVDSSVGDVRATYKFRNIPWDQALEIILSNANLDKEFRNGVLRVATTQKFEEEELARARLIAQRELSVPTETVTVDLNYAKAKDVVPIVQEYLSPRGSIIKDDRTNILIIRDIPKFMVDIRTLINRLDKRISQVSIEARVVETSTTFLKELGVQWGLTANYTPSLGTETGLDFPHRINLGGPRIGQPRSIRGPEGGYAVNLPTVSESSGFGLTLGNFLDNFKLDISMQLLESEGHGQVISSPKVTTQNNKTALLINGAKIPIQTVNRGVVTTRYVNAALEMEVTPQITADETIILDLIVDKSEADFSRTVNGNPLIKVSRAETQVLVKNGGTAVIGGIFALSEQDSSRGIPMLRKVPVLKRLFSADTNQYNNQELLIFVTPKIVKY